MKQSCTSNIGRRFLQGIWFHSHKKNRTDSPCTRSPDRDCFSNNDALRKHKENGFLIRSWLWLVQHCRRILVRRYLINIYVYNLSSLHPANVNSFNKIKWCHIMKDKKLIISLKNNERRWLFTSSLVSAWSTSISHSLEQTRKSIGLCVKVNKTYFLYFKEEADISTLNSKSMKLVDQFTYLGSNISSD